MIQSTEYLPVCLLIPTHSKLLCYPTQLPPFATQDSLARALIAADIAVILEQTSAQMLICGCEEVGRKAKYKASQVGNPR
jgi:hypothetical protein